MTLQPIDQHIDALAAARDAIAACGTPGEAMEAVARVAAAKAWAKAHGTLRDLRLQLLTLEVEALIRVIELGGGHLLSPTERAAGEALAAMTPEARDLLVTKSAAGSTTAAGLVRRLLAERDESDRRYRARAAGGSWARGDRSVASELGDILDRHTARLVTAALTDGTSIHGALTEAGAL